MKSEPKICESILFVISPCIQIQIQFVALCRRSEKVGEEGALMSLRVFWLWIGLGLLFPLLLLSRPANARTTSASALRGLVKSTHEECKDAATNCVSEQQDPVTMPPDARQTFTFACSAADPYLQGWDAAAHRLISLSVVSFTSGSVTLIAKNDSVKPRGFIVTLGCMTEPTTSTDFLSGIGYKPKGK